MAVKSRIAKEWCILHRKSLLLGAAGLLLFCLFRVARGSRALMDRWVQTVSMPYKRVVSAAVDGLPGSFCELAATLAILFALGMLARCILLAVRRKTCRFGVWLLHFGVSALWIYLLVCAFWGTQYYCESFAEWAGMQAGPVAAADLAAVTRYFAEQVNATADTVPRTAAGAFAVDTQTILAHSEGIYAGIVEEYPFLAGPERRAKPAVYSKLMSAWGFTGYLCPLFGESTVNVDCPAVFLPATVAHEFAHQRGVAAEQEANFCGIQASIASGRAEYIYSGWLMGYLYLGNALYEADREAWAEISAGLCPQAAADLAENNAYWKRWEGPVNTVGDTVYTALLQSYDQTLGMKSYGACVDLLVEKYIPYTTGNG